MAAAQGYPEGWARRMAEVIREARERQGWTQGQLAEVAGTDQRTVSRLEKATLLRPNAASMVAVLTVLQVPRNWICEALGLAPLRLEADTMSILLGGDAEARVRGLADHVDIQVYRETRDYFMVAPEWEQRLMLETLRVLVKALRTRQAQQRGDGTEGEQEKSPTRAE